MSFSTEEEISVSTNTAISKAFQLILWNDDVNTFDWVIKALCDICHMSDIQAEQCSIIVHNKGKCSVQHGDYDELSPMCDAITDRGIGATVEELVH